MNKIGGIIAQVLNWGFGIVFLISWISLLTEQTIPSIFLLLIWLLLIPPFQKFIEEKWKLSFNIKTKSIVIAILFVIATISLDSSEYKETQQPVISQEGQTTNKVESTSANNDIVDNTPLRQETPEKTEIIVDETNVSKTVIDSEKTDTLKEVPTEEKIEVTEKPVEKIEEVKEEVHSSPVEETATNSNDSIINDHCKSKWANDNDMIEYCKEQQYEGLSTLERGKPNDITKEQFSTIRTHCTNKWYTDFSMRAYCEWEQYKAVRTLNQGKPNDITDEEFSIIRTQCTNKWYTDYSMRAYCEGEQYEWVRTLNQGLPDGVTDAMRTSCANKWSTDYIMRVYCESQY